MKVSQKLNCMFSEWYKKFRSVTIESVVLDIPNDLLTYLLSDDPIVLPQGECKSSHLNDDDDDDSDTDWGTDAPNITGSASNFSEFSESMKKSMFCQEKQDDDDDFDVVNESAVVAPEFPEFSKTVERCIAKLGGSVVPKLNWSAPKDATWINFNQSMRCATFTDVLLLIKSSVFVTHDLTQPFFGCVDSERISEEDLDGRETVKVSSSIKYQLALRRWCDISGCDEFRCFVADGNRVVAITQRNESVHQTMDIAVKDILNFFDKKIKGNFSDVDDFVFDVWVRAPGDVVLIDFNPWGSVTDSLLFTWEELEEIRDSKKELQTRCIDAENGIRADALSCYRMPQDFLDLCTGLDPAKFNDLMHLHENGIQSCKEKKVTNKKTEMISTSTLKESVHDVPGDENVSKINTVQDHGTNKSSDVNIQFSNLLSNDTM